MCFHTFHDRFKHRSSSHIFYSLSFNQTFNQLCLDSSLEQVFKTNTFPIHPGGCCLIDASFIIYLFIHSFTHSFSPSFFYSFGHSLICAFISFIWSMRSFIATHSFINTLTHLFNYSFILTILLILANLLILLILITVLLI